MTAPKPWEEGWLSHKAQELGVDEGAIASVVKDVSLYAGELGLRHYDDGNDDLGKAMGQVSKVLEGLAG